MSSRYTQENKSDTRRMKNNECTIYIITKSGWKQTYKKVDDTWMQTTNKVVRKMTAEQLLSHMLPLLIKGQSRAKLVVIKNKSRR